MKYFCTESERIGTCYHEFYKGKFDGVDFWKADSLLIHEDIHYAIKFEELIRFVITKYNPVGETEVTQEEWNMIYNEAFIRGGELRDAIFEANSWVEDTFKEYEVFTMIGM